MSSPSGRVYWVEEPGSAHAYPKEFRRLCPEAQQAWVKAKYKLPLGSGFLARLKPEHQAHLIVELAKLPDQEAYASQREAEDRAELVRPAPKDFKPEGRRKIRLVLIPKQRRLKTGENFWYRLELQNVGKEPILFDDRPSFWKIGNRFMPCHFYITPPDGKEVRGNLVEDFMDSREKTIVLPDHLTTDEARRKYAAEIVKEEGNRRSRLLHLHVNLQPGETLVTRAWRFGTFDEQYERTKAGEHPHPPISGDFRELALENLAFDQPGTYKVKATYEDPLRSYQDQEWASQSLGIAESNSVLVEVYK
ncbi:MAG: hypothetical protein WC943_10885, partial [Elusimicrobiota bacterium]